MRKWVYTILIALLIAGGAVLCAVRWQAWFGMPEEPIRQGEQRTYRFPSFEKDYTPESLDILVLGDIHNGLTRADYDTLAARVPHADIIAQSGDWMDRGQNYYYQALLDEWTPSALYGKPVIVCPGNHEYTKGLHKTLSPIWSQAFHTASNGPQDVPGVSYYVDLPQLRFIVIDTNPLDHVVYLTRTLTWLRRAMYSAGDRYIVVMMHHPVISAAEGRWNPLIHGTFRYALSQADLVIAGHDHSYMRKGPFVVLNAAGRPKRQRAHMQADVLETEPTYSVLSIKQSRVHQGQSPMSFVTYRLSDGKVIDIVYVKHD
jgi:predicted phosphodiesterase